MQWLRFVQFVLQQICFKMYIKNCQHSIILFFANSLKNNIHSHAFLHILHILWDAQHIVFISLFLHASWYRNNISTHSVLSENAQVEIIKMVTLTHTGKFPSVRWRFIDEDVNVGIIWPPHRWPCQSLLWWGSVSPAALAVVWPLVFVSYASATHRRLHFNIECN